MEVKKNTSLINSEKSNSLCDTSHLTVFRLNVFSNSFCCQLCIFSFLFQIMLFNSYLLHYNFLVMCYNNCVLCMTPSIYQYLHQLVENYYYYYYLFYFLLNKFTGCFVNMFTFLLEFYIIIVNMTYLTFKESVFK